jgi:hypothetical protein
VADKLVAGKLVADVRDLLFRRPRPSSTDFFPRKAERGTELSRLKSLDGREDQHSPCFLGR